MENMGSSGGVNSSCMGGDFVDLWMAVGLLSN